MQNTNFSLEIERIPFSRLLKSEMADYTEKTIGIFEKHEPESPLINPVFELLRAKMPEIRLLRLSYGIDTERLRMNKLKSEMMLKISALKIKVRMASKSHLPLDIHILENAINSHLRLLHKCRNDKQLNQKVAGFLDLVAYDAVLSELMDELDLGRDVEAIKIAHVIVNATSEKRVKMLSQRPTVSTKVIVKDLAKAIDNLFKGIEVGHLLNVLPNGEEPGEGTDFTPLIDELNQLSEMYNRSISIRDANNKRKAKLEEEGDSEVEPTGDSGTHSAVKTMGDLPIQTQSATMTNTDQGKDNSFDPKQMYVPSFKTMNTPSGPASTIAPQVDSEAGTDNA